MTERKFEGNKRKLLTRSLSAMLIVVLLLLTLFGCMNSYKPYIMNPQEDLSAPGQDQVLSGDKTLAQDVTESTQATETTEATAAATSATTTASTTAAAPEPDTEADGQTATAAEQTAATTAEPYETEEYIPAETEAPQTAAIDEDGYYYSKDDVALYIHTYGKLPQNFISKKEAEELGWSGGSVERYKKGCAIGGDRFSNYEGLLPKQRGRVYTECDIDTKGKKTRGAKRIVFSNDGLIFYTDDHYETFTQLYP